MSEMRWRGRGPDFELDWAGLSWRLKLDGPRPGLELVGSEGALLLGLAGLAARGRSCCWEYERPILTKFDCLFGRVESSYTFPDWGGLALRASWSVIPEIEGLDLEVQISADSVDFLKALEVQVVTRLDDTAGPELDRSAVEAVVEPRDRESAALSYDGREPWEILRRLSTLPVPARIGAGFAPSVIETPWLGAGRRYVEFVHPDDVARRQTERRAGAGAGLRYGIFGHDLEKGVVLRSRMRGFWAPGPVSGEDIDASYREFREAPLPLGP